MAAEEKITVKKDKNAKKDFIQAVGRRREAIARVRYYANPKADVLWGERKIVKGEIIVNGKLISEYFSGDVAKKKYEEPLRVVNLLDKGIITVIVAGGGTNGQLEATIHGIARVMTKHDTAEHRVPLKKKGFLVRDPRARQRRKVGMGGKSRRKKQSPKR